MIEYELLSFFTYVNHVVNNSVLSGRYNPRNPFAMTNYGISITSLDEVLDNSNAVGSLDIMKKLLESLKKHVFAFDNHLTKCHIIIKQRLLKKHSIFLFTTTWVLLLWFRDFRCRIISPSHQVVKYSPPIFTEMAISCHVQTLSSE